MAFLGLLTWIKGIAWYLAEIEWRKWNCFPNKGGYQSIKVLSLFSKEENIGKTTRVEQTTIFNGNLPIQDTVKNNEKQKWFFNNKKFEDEKQILGYSDIKNNLLSHHCSKIKSSKAKDISIKEEEHLLELKILATLP